MLKWPQLNHTLILFAMFVPGYPAICAVDETSQRFQGATREKDVAMVYT